VLHWLFLNLPPLHVSWQAGAVTLLAVLVTALAARASWRWVEGPLVRRGHRVAYD
jgi:peptidoglycan/LPS O-acetylase OafA/YrhL